MNLQVAAGASQGIEGQPDVRPARGLYLCLEKFRAIWVRIDC